MKKTLTPDEIVEQGLDSLRRRLGKSGMIRFLQQFESGSGDYTRERRKWVEQTSIDDIFAAVKRMRRTRKRNRV
jgi:hypothetical protein